LPGPQLASAIVAANRSEADEARKTLRRLLVEGQAIAQVHFILGTDAWENGNHQEAQLHWERALELAPGTASTANNLACLIHETEPSKLDKALDLANLAIKSAPGETNFLDTRGRILFKMAKRASDPKDAQSKLKLALRDLEEALPRSPNSDGLHRTLAEIYDRLDVPRMADEHRRMADEISGKKHKK
jgi:Tfp pilus assembly protein PilF